MTSEKSTTKSPDTSAFVTTQWTRVLEARGDSPEAKAALSDLCAAYYEPVLAFIQRSPAGPESARDLTHEFFARLLARHGISHVDPQRGRFRSFLLGAVKHFLANTYDREHRIKRGAGQTMESTDRGTDTSTELQIADPGAPSPDREFDRRWALTLLERSLTALEREHEACEKREQFEALKPWLTGENGNISQAEVAARLGMSEGAVKVAIHRLRRRFRELIKNEIAQTVNDRSEIDMELHYLLEALSR